VIGCRTYHAGLSFMRNGSNCRSGQFHARAAVTTGVKAWWTPKLIWTHQRVVKSGNLPGNRTTFCKWSSPYASRCTPFRWSHRMVSVVYAEYDTCVNCNVYHSAYLIVVFR
jgi:hypothetical protein